MIEKYIKAAVWRFPEIEIWDLNEPIIRNALGWSLEQNYEIFVLASKWIRETNLKAKVMVNMFPTPGRYDLVYEPTKVMNELMRRGLEVDVIGMELYYFWAGPNQQDEDGYPSMEWVEDRINLFTAYRLPIILSEVGVPGKMKSKDLWEQQADWMEELFRLCHDKPGVIGTVWYCVRDDPFLPYGGLASDDYSLRPVGQRLLKLANEWNPAVEYQLNGLTFIDLEPGEYDVVIGDFKPGTYDPTVGIQTFRVVVYPNQVVTLSSVK